MTQRIVPTLLLTILVWVASPGSARACSCAGAGAACDAAWQADAVFVGEVVSMSLTRGRQVELAVMEPFRGLQLTQVAIETGYGGGDCGYPFELGQSYVVYAHRTPEGRFTTSICSRTRAVREATEDLAYLRSLASVVSVTRGRLSGQLFLWQYPVPPDGLKKVPRVVVTATAGNRTFAASTNERGEFELTRLPLGTYDLIAKAPNGYQATKRTVTLHDPRGCGVTPLYIQYDGRVSGRIIESQGTGIPGLAIELVLPGDVDRPGGGRKKLMARTEADGSYEIALVTPDNYLLGVNSIRIVNSRPTVAGPQTSARAFYPGVLESADASTIVVTEGARVHLQDFVIPTAIKLVTVTSIVVDESGQPVGEARLIPRGNTNAPFPLGPAFVTGSDGRFVFTVIESGRYDIHAERYVRADPYREVEVAITPFTATRGLPPLTIVLKPNPYR